MVTDVEVRCRCGNVRGVLREVSPDRGTRGICYCDDCQAFAHFLGHAEDILDDHGGSDIFQTSPARLTFTEGTKHLGSVAFTPRLLRWYATCCRTPIGNTLPTATIPFVGLIHSCLQAQDPDSVFGPLLFRVHGRYAQGDTRALNAHPRAPLSLFWRFGRMVLGTRLRGDHRRSPFFQDNGTPVVDPEQLTPDQLREIKSHM